MGLDSDPNMKKLIKGIKVTGLVDSWEQRAHYEKRKAWKNP